MMDGQVEMLRHTVATLAYRGGKALRGAPETFSAFRAAEGTRTPGEILAHISDLLDWAISLANGAQKWQNSAILPWNSGILRFFSALEAFDARLASPEPLRCSPEQLFQGPVADALTHVGQINLLRRMSGAPIKGENYCKAEIRKGTVGSQQPAPRVEFD
jgi:hypothetical protein